MIIICLESIIPSNKCGLLDGEKIHEKNPTRLVEKSIKGMLPKNKLGAELFRNLYVVSGAEHPYDGQKPTAVNINELN